MTPQQIQWAAQHDWFIRADKHGVYAHDNNGDDNGQNRVGYFQDFKELRTWAGY